jgi:SOS-response transcriptional repressor LexA
MTGITKQQKTVLEYIQHYIAETGFSPSFSDIGRGTGIKAKSHVRRQVVALQRRGYLVYEPYCSRTITVLFSSDKRPEWEALARALYIENIKIRQEAANHGIKLKTPRAVGEQ